MKKLSILLIEDDPDQIFMYQNKFELEGFNFRSARKGDDGIALAKKHRPDIILVDLVLIAENGLDVLTKLKSDPTTADIPVMILTNLVKKESMVRAHALGAADFVIKTEVMPAEIVQKVRAILRT